MGNVSINTAFVARHTKTIERSKKSVRAGAFAPNWQLNIPFSYLTPKQLEDMPGEHVHDPDFGDVIQRSWDHERSDWTDRFVSANVTYDADGGAGMRVTVEGKRLMGYEGFPIILMASYGPGSAYTDIQPIFQGHIYDINDHPNGTTELQCFANAKIRGSQVLGQRLDYRNLTLAEAMRDVMLRTGRFYGWKVVGGFDYVIHDPEVDNPDSNQPGQGEFMSEATFQEVETTLCEPAGYIAFDNPMGRKIMKKPSLRSGEFMVTNFQESEYDHFTFTPGQRGFYSKVQVFRRTQDGGGTPYELRYPGAAQGYLEDYEVFAERDVDTGDRFEPPFNRYFVVPDFNGTQEEAQLEANRLANYYAETGGEFEYEGSLADFWLYDSFGLYRTEKKLPTDTAYLYGIPIPISGGYSHLKSYYKNLIDGGIEFEIAKGVFKVRCRGSGILANVAGIQSPSKTSYRSTGLVPDIVGEPPPPASPTFTQWGQEDITIGEVEETYAELT